jgi:hypothetical protein
MTSCFLKETPMIISSGSYPSMFYNIQLLPTRFWYWWIFHVHSSTILKWRQEWWLQKDLASGCCLSSTVSNIIKCEWLVYTLLNHQESGRWQKCPCAGFIQSIPAKFICLDFKSNLRTEQGVTTGTEWFHYVFAILDGIVSFTNDFRLWHHPFSVLSTGEQAGLVSLTMWGGINQISFWKTSTIFFILLGCQNIDLGLHSSHICEQKMPRFKNHHICLIFLQRKKSQKVVTYQDCVVQLLWTPENVSE